MAPRKEHVVSDHTLPILVAAYGNELAADDSFGPLVAEAVRGRALAGVEVVTLGMRPMSLLDYLAGRSAVCVVDAASCEDAPPGTLLDMDFLDANRPRLVYDHALSSHGLSVADELELARQLGTCPKDVWLVAAVANSVEVGRPICEEVLSLVPTAAARIADWAGRILEFLARDSS